MRRTWLALSGLLALVALSSCVQKMGEVGHVHPYHFTRLPVEGTIARGHLPSPIDNPAFRENPLPITKALLQRGRGRFEIYCTPCHGFAGYGDGVVVQRGFPAPPSYHSARVRDASDGHIYGVIRDGFGMMYAYGDRIDVKDRWAIVAYIRTLELSQNFPISKLQAKERAVLEGADQ